MTSQATIPDPLVIPTRQEALLARRWKALCVKEGHVRGIPERGYHHSPVATAVGADWKTTEEIAARVMVRRDSAQNALRAMQKRGVVQRRDWRDASGQRVSIWRLTPQKQETE